MSVLKRARKAGPRKVGLALTGLLTAGLAVASATMLTTTGASATTTMTDMAQTMSVSVSHGHTGFTNGWYDGHTVRFFYSKNFFCSTPPASKASSKCEAGADYTQTPASSFDPLYVVVPLGFTPPKNTLQCPVAGHCIDWDLQYLRRHDPKEVTGNITTNLFLYFAVLR